MSEKGGQLVARQVLRFQDFVSSSPERRRVAEAGRGILTNMFEHVDAQRVVRVYEEA